MKNKLTLDVNVLAYRLGANKVQGGLATACVGCEKCLTACPTCALRKESLTELTLAGNKITYLPVDANRCDWASKYALVCEEGNKCTGNFTDVPCPEVVTGEKCIVTCPLRGKSLSKREKGLLQSNSPLTFVIKFPADILPSYGRSAPAADYPASNPGNFAVPPQDPTWDNRYRTETARPRTG